MPHRCWCRRIDEQEWPLHSPLKERELRTCMHFDKLSEWVDVLGSTQVTMRSDGEPVVMHVTTLETSALGDHAGNGWAERAVGLVGGVVRTHKNDLEFSCQMQKPPQSRTNAWVTGHATTLLNLDTVGSDGKVPFERWRGRGHHMGRCVFGVGPLTDRTKAEDRMESSDSG